MCRTEFDIELGECAVQLYPTIESLKRDRPCIPECGLVAVKVELIRVVEPGIPYRERGKNSSSQ